MQVGDEDLRPERNGYGGESMLVEFTSASWATVEPIQDYERKLEVMAAISEVVTDHGLWSLYSFNDPTASGIDPAMIAKHYGSDDPAHADHVGVLHRELPRSRCTSTPTINETSPTIRTEDSWPPAKRRTPAPASLSKACS